MPVYISDRRLAALRGTLNCVQAANIATGPDEWYCFGSSPSGRQYLFYLKRHARADVPGGSTAAIQPGGYLWSLHYALTETAVLPGMDMPSKVKGLNYLPVTAVVDPRCDGRVRGSYLAATTGDYDLWGIFPARNLYSRRGADRRPVPNSDRFQRPMSAFIAHEDPHLGNITSRGRNIRLAINAYARHPGGDIVHHSDEAGRPCVDDIDFPAILWVPGESEPVAVCNVGDLKRLIGDLRFQYQLVLNPGWFRELGIGVSMGGSYEV